MIKREELSNPQSCINKARDDEMVFVLLARDPAAATVIRLWAYERIRIGKNTNKDAQIIDALRCADQMDEQLRAQK